MTPYDLERARDRLREAASAGPAAPHPLINAIAEAQIVILQHLADVEGDLNLERANAERG